jgi:broad specificity phosphatase PhoE
MEEFDEYHGDAVLEQALPHLLESNDEVRKLHRAFQNSSGPDRRRVNFEKMFETVITKWVDGEVSLPTVESWEGFCTRVDRGLSQCISANGRGQQLAIFCSGGLIGVAMRRAFHLSAQDTLRAAWMVRNCAYSEFLFSNDRFTLSSFNGLPYLDDASLLTYR